MSKYFTPALLIAVGAAFVAFALINGVLLYFQDIPRTTLEINLPVLGQAVTAKISNVPDPYALGTTVARAVVLLALGLVGAKILEVGLAEWRIRRREAQWLEYYSAQHGAG